MEGRRLPRYSCVYQRSSGIYVCRAGLVKPPSRVILGEIGGGALNASGAIDVVCTAVCISVSM